MKYRYQGVTRNRDQVSGQVEADNENQAVLKLRSQQIRATKIQPVGEGMDFDLGSIFDLKMFQGIDLKSLMVFTRQFSSLVDSGVPIVQCLGILYDQERKKHFRAVLAKIKEDLEAGLGLAEAFSRHRHIFNEFYIRVLEAGEVSGTLDKALRRAGIQLEKLGRLRAKVINAMLYPGITLVVAIGVLIFLLVRVVPEISKLYGSNADLPQLTQMVLALSYGVQNNFMLIIGAFVALFVGMFVGYRLPDIRELIDPILLRVPILGSLLLRSAVAKLSRTLSTLITSGVPLVQAFEICIKLMDNMAIRNAVKTAASFVQEGKTIAAGLAYNNIFPPMVIHMVNIGEVTGRLDELLGKLADIYDDEVDDAVNNITGLLQPALIVLVGGVIAFLLLAMYLPIFQLADKISGG